MYATIFILCMWFSASGVEMDGTAVVHLEAFAHGTDDVPPRARDKQTAQFPPMRAAENKACITDYIST